MTRIREFLILSTLLFALTSCGGEPDDDLTSTDFAEILSASSQGMDDQVMANFDKVLTATLDRIEPSAPSPRLGAQEICDDKLVAYHEDISTIALAIEDKAREIATCSAVCDGDGCETLARFVSEGERISQASFLYRSQMEAAISAELGWEYERALTAFQRSAILSQLRYSISDVLRYRHSGDPTDWSVNLEALDFARLAFLGLFQDIDNAYITYNTRHNLAMLDTARALNAGLEDFLELGAGRFEEQDPDFGRRLAEALGRAVAALSNLQALVDDDGPEPAESEDVTACLLRQSDLISYAANGIERTSRLLSGLCDGKPECAVAKPEAEPIANPEVEIEYAELISELLSSFSESSGALPSCS